jgi:hypothetical protein
VTLALDLDLESFFFETTREVRGMLGCGLDTELDYVGSVWRDPRVSRVYLRVVL